MNKALTVKIAPIVGKTLVAVDITDYSDIGVDISEHTMIDFLSFNDETTAFSQLSEWEVGEKPYAELPLNYDGIVYYYKLAVPKIEHFYNSVGYDGIEQQLFMYQNKLYYCNLSLERGYTIDEVLIASDPIGNYVDAYNIVEKNKGMQTFYFPKYKLLIYLKLQECLVKLQKQLLFGTKFKPCSFSNSAGSASSCATDQALKGQVDFLLTALYIIEYLKNIGNFEEALEILERIQTCQGLCEDDYGTSKGCGCGKAV